MNSTPHLESKLRQIYDHLYANASIKTPAGIAKEVGKILRVLSFLQKGKEDILNYFNKLNKKLGTEDAELIHRVGSEVKAAFKKMNENLKIYSKEENMRLSDFDISYVCGKLDGIMIDSQHKDVFGDAMEVFRSSWTKQNGGQFFTDQRITNLAVKLLKFNPLAGDDLVDICAGTGGFLLAGLNRIKQLVNGSDKKIKKIAISSLKGQEIDEELHSVANATLSLRTGLNCDEEIVHHGDSILPDAFSSNKTRIKINSHSCVATNPPFGTKITIKDPNILKFYELAKSRNGLKMSLFGEESSKISNRAPDILFIEQNVRLLKPGHGRLAIVVPYQIVSGPQTLFVREWILKNTQLLAVIDLPPETFQPHTGTKASLVIVKRRLEPLRELDLSNDPLIFMATPRWIGHDRRGNPTYKRNIDGSFTDEILSDFPDVENAFDQFDIGENPSLIHPSCYTVSPKDILLQADLRIDARSHILKGKDSHRNINKKPENQSWQYLKLNDVVKKIFYPGRFSRHYVEHINNSVPFLGGTNISQLILKTEKRISLDHPNINELKVEQGWILITRSGSTGIVSVVPKAWEGFAISEHVIRIIPDPKKLPPEYLYAFLRTKYAQDIIARGVYGSVIDEITPEYIGNIEIPIPKSNTFLDEIVEIIRKGENARQQAVESLTLGVEEIEKKLFC